MIERLGGGTSDKAESAGMRVLLVEDCPAFSRALTQKFKQGPHSWRVADTAAAALECILDYQPELVVLDLGLPDMPGKEFIAKLRETGDTTPVIAITGSGDISTAVEIVRFGAVDFLVKPFSTAKLEASMEQAAKLERATSGPPSAAAGPRRPAASPPEGLLIGESRKMREVKERVELAARSNANILILGESGAVKEAVAAMIHVLGARAFKPFIVRNCAAMPASMVESELFGHVKGAFTGALQDRKGAAALADQGELFLDEIGEMPIELQPKLLRFLQTGEYTPVGGDAMKKADIRFVSATNRDPEIAVKQGHLREDLLYRLSVITIELPPLRARDRDAVLLAEHFLAKYAAAEHKRFRSITSGAAAKLLSYSWPGNVRQLQNIIYRAVVLNDGERLEAHMIELPRSAQDKEIHAPSQIDEADYVSLRGRTFEELERQIIEAALDRANSNIQGAARALGIDPSTIHRKRKKWAGE